MILTGRVYDEKTKQGIPSATIAVMKGGQLTGEGTVADPDGNFSVTMSDPSSDIRVSAIGYITLVASPIDTYEAIYLTPYTNQLPGVTITAPAPTTNTGTYTPPVTNAPVQNQNQTKTGPTWAELQPLLIGVLIVFVVGYLINEANNR